VNADWLLCAFAFVIFLKLIAEAASGHADNGIEARVKIRGTVEDFQAEAVFLEFILLAAQGMFDRIAEEALQDFGIAEGVAGKDCFENAKNRVVRNMVGGLRSNHRAVLRSRRCHGKLPREGCPNSDIGQRKWAGRAP